MLASPQLSKIAISGLVVKPVNASWRSSIKQGKIFLQLAFALSFFSTERSLLTFAISKTPFSLIRSDTYFDHNNPPT